jgi:hypothetical protein
VQRHRPKVCLAGCVAADRLARWINGVGRMRAGIRELDGQRVREGLLAEAVAVQQAWRRMFRRDARLTGSVNAIH